MSPYQKHWEYSKRTSLRLWWPCGGGQRQRARVQQGLEAGKMPTLTLGSWTQEEEEAVSEEEEEDEKSMPSLPSTKPITY